MSKKVAVCFFAFLRKFKITNTSILEKIVKPLDADVFMHCPNTYWPYSSEDPFFNQENPEKVTKEYLSSVFNDHLKGLTIWDYNANIFKNRVINSNLPDGYFTWHKTWRTLSMFHSIQNSLRLKTQYEKNNIKTKH